MSQSSAQSLTAVLAALGAAALFGASTPLARDLALDLHPTMLASLLYLPSGVVLLGYGVASGRFRAGIGLKRKELVWLVGAIAAGGVLAPTLLMAGLARMSGSAASLLLNLEAVFTAAIAWVVFRENAGRRVVMGMLCIVLGGLALAWPHNGIAVVRLEGALLVAAACACWAVDNNLTRQISAGDAVFIAGAKGLSAGLVNFTLSLVLNAHLPSVRQAAEAGALGVLGYGLSLVLFVVALRGLGAARTGAYFSTAPFVGAALAVTLLGEDAQIAFWIAAALMGAGVWLHLTEQHAHPHVHDLVEHTHEHVHDADHGHDHDFSFAIGDSHTHPHRHERISHTHPHYPDVHHRHEH